MQELIEQLKELQRIDSELKFIQELKGNLPHQINILHSEFEESENTYKGKKQTLDQTKTELRLTQAEIEDLKKKKNKYQDQLYQVTNNKEYDAVTSEIDNVNSTLNEKEDKVISLMDQEEKLTAELEHDEKELEALSENLKTKEAELEKKNAKTEKEEIALNDKRNTLASRMNNRYLSMYDRIRGAKGGLAVVSIQNGSCGGCSKRLPTQKILEIRSMNKLYLCEVCGRILIWDGDK